MSIRARTSRRIARAAALAPLVAALVAAVARSAGAQERLTGVRTATAGVFVESYDFGGGLAQRSGVSGAASTIRSATQRVVPVSLAVPLGTRWTADVATIVTSGEARFAPAGGGPETTASLAGVGDVRLRATGRLVGDNLLLTLGANVGTGVRGLTTTQVAALGVLAAPALGSVTPAASAGPSATTGLVYAFQRAGWSWAAGAGVEARGAYSPVAALTAGIAAPEFNPGTAIHLSLGSDGFVGEGALSVALTADVYAQDRLVVGSGTARSQAAVQLGPTLGAELQWRAPTTRFRELVVYAAERYRGAFTRDGARVAGSSASYLSAGARAAYPLGRATDLTTSVDLWRHGGLAADNSLVTASTTSGALGLGLARRIGATYTLQPYVRLRAGAIDTGAGSTGVTGGGVGVNLAARF